MIDPEQSIKMLGPFFQTTIRVIFLNEDKENKKLMKK